MSLIGNIAGVPLFSTIQEALDWANDNNLTGYHVHSLQGQRGYMGGLNHLQATNMPLNSNAPTVSRTTSSGGGSGY